MNINNEFYKQGQKDALEWILAEAETFECCPYCGNTDLKVSKHFCEKCKKRIVEPDDAYGFYQYIKKKMEKVLK